MDNYSEALKLFKQSLIGGSEKEIIFDEISKMAPSNRLRWLDIGIGDGAFSEKVILMLENAGFSVEVTGVDTDKKSLIDAQKRFPDAKLIKSDFENLKIEGKFDVIYFSQSLYYAKDRKEIIKRLIGNLSEGGILVVVAWSKEDTLFRIYDKIYSKGDSFNSEKVYSILKKFNSFTKIVRKKFVGQVDFSVWKQNRGSLKKMERVISRFSNTKQFSEETINFLNKELDLLGDISPRINGVVIAKKKYEISDFYRERLIDLLKKRFPSYSALISKAKGDSESLFMASWEKETDHLSKKFVPGRVLEVCCASGFKSVILAKRHRVVAMDLNKKRVEFAKENADLFGVSDRISFLARDASKKSSFEDLGDFSAIFVDADWREDLRHPIKKQNIDPFKTTPRTDELYFTLRALYPEVPIVFKVSPFVRVKGMQKLGPCEIEELYISGKFLSYNVYYSPRIKTNKYSKIKL